MPAFPSMLSTRLYALEGGADPAVHGRAGWATDMILKALDEFKFVEVHIAATPPATTEEVWLTLDAGNAQGGTARIWNTVSLAWEIATPALFARLLNRLVGAASSGGVIAPTASLQWDGLADGMYDMDVITSNPPGFFSSPGVFFRTMASGAVTPSIDATGNPVIIAHVAAFGGAAILGGAALSNFGGASIQFAKSNGRIIVIQNGANGEMMQSGGGVITNATGVAIEPVTSTNVVSAQVTRTL